VYPFSISLGTQRGRAAIKFYLVADLLEHDTIFYQRAVKASMTGLASRFPAAPSAVAWLLVLCFPRGGRGGPAARG